MTIQECYRILNVANGAGMEEIKSSFRRLAFKYHPDLNPSQDAAQEFRRLNEAYVLLKDIVKDDATERARARAREAHQRPTANKAQGADAYAKQQSQGKPDARSRKRTSRAFYREEEEVLRDILRDPFAKKVFEDIYRQVKRNDPGFKPRSKIQKRGLELHWGSKSLNLDISKGFFGGIKSMFTGQMDYEQTVHFPAGNLLPGRSVTITVKQRFSGKPKKIEITLPPDFVIGRPIRLKGLGRKLGPLKGDLLLRILAK